MNDTIRLIKEYKVTKHKKEHLLVLLERSRKVEFPIYSLIQILNSTSNIPAKIISSEGWLENDFGLQQKRKLLKKEQEAHKKVTAEFEKNKKEALFLKKKYLLIPAIIAIFLLVFFVIIPLYESFKENKVWERSKLENTIDSYYDYVILYPNGNHINEALMKMDIVKKKKEDEIWEEVLRNNTKQDYIEYLNKYNNKDAPFYSEAKRLIDEIDWNKAFKEKKASNPGHSDIKKYLINFFDFTNQVQRDTVVDLRFLSKFSSGYWERAKFKYPKLNKENTSSDQIRLTLNDVILEISNCKFLIEENDVVFSPEYPKRADKINNMTYQGEGDLPFTQLCKIELSFNGEKKLIDVSNYKNMFDTHMQDITAYLKDNNEVIIVMSNGDGANWSTSALIINKSFEVILKHFPY